MSACRRVLSVARAEKLSRYGAEVAPARIGVVSDRADFRVTPEEAGGPA